MERDKTGDVYLKTEEARLFRRDQATFVKALRAFLARHYVHSGTVVLRDGVGSELGTVDLNSSS